MGPWHPRHSFVSHDQDPDVTSFSSTGSFGDLAMWQRLIKQAAAAVPSFSPGQVEFRAHVILDAAAALLTTILWCFARGKVRATKAVATSEELQELNSAIAAQCRAPASVEGPVSIFALLREADFFIHMYVFF